MSQPTQTMTRGTTIEPNAGIRRSSCSGRVNKSLTCAHEHRQRKIEIVHTNRHLPSPSPCFSAIHRIVGFVSRNASTSSNNAGRRLPYQHYSRAAHNNSNTLECTPRGKPVHTRPFILPPTAAILRHPSQWSLKISFALPITAKTKASFCLTTETLIFAHHAVTRKRYKEFQFIPTKTEFGIDNCATQHICGIEDLFVDMRAPQPLLV